MNCEREKMEQKKSLLKSWVEAARPKTLPASLSPVLLACVLAWCEGVFRLIPAILCFGVALLAQIASNFANDYFDFKKGADREDRLGPERAVAQGWITPGAAGSLYRSELPLLFVCWPILPDLFLWLIMDWEMSV